MRLLLAVLSITFVECALFGDVPMQNQDLFEGDILRITDNQDRNIPADRDLHWPNATVYYVIDPALRQSVPLILEIMRDFENNTCLKFKERIMERDYVRIFKDLGCYSQVGRIKSEQLLSLGDGCINRGIIAHELGHTIGFWHEQSRSDRDDYVNILWKNIQRGMESQFIKLSPHQNVLYTPFDYESIMIYGETAFGKNRWSKTMTPKKKGMRIKDVSEKYRPSKSDYQRINDMYEC